MEADFASQGAARLEISVAISGDLGAFVVALEIKVGAGRALPAVQADLDDTELDSAAVAVELNVAGAEHVDVVGVPAFNRGDPPTAEHGRASLLRHWLALRELIHGPIQSDPSINGIIVQHGTATLEETAFFLNLTLAIRQTVVLVGAQRPASAVGTDAGANLIAALRVAGAPEAAGLGVLVVLNDETHAARDVVKTSTSRLQTFRSPDFSALGHVDSDGIHILRRPARRHAPETNFAGLLPATLPRVDIALSYAGADAAMVQAAVGAGGSFPQGWRRGLRPRLKGRRWSRRWRMGSWSCSAAGPAVAGSGDDAMCARRASSPARILARRRHAYC